MRRLWCLLQAICLVVVVVLLAGPTSNTATVTEVQVRPFLDYGRHIKGRRPIVASVRTLPVSSATRSTVPGIQGNGFSQSLYGPSSRVRPFIHPAWNAPPFDLVADAARRHFSVASAVSAQALAMGPLKRSKYPYPIYSTAPDVPKDRRDNPASTDVTMMLWNVHNLGSTQPSAKTSPDHDEAGGKAIESARIRHIARYLEEQDADVIFLVEVVDPQALLRMLDGFKSAKKRKQYRAYLVPGKDKQTNQNVAMLTKVDPSFVNRFNDRAIVLSVAETPGGTAKQSVHFVDEKDRASRKNADVHAGLSKHLAATFQFGSSKIGVLLAHLLSKKFDGRQIQSRRLGQFYLARYLLQRLFKEQNDVMGGILLGDFNDDKIPTTPENFWVSRAGLDNLWRKLAPRRIPGSCLTNIMADNLKTYRNHQLDGIYVTPGLTPLEVDVKKPPATVFMSDHNPVFFKLALSESPPSALQNCMDQLKMTGSSVLDQLSAVTSKIHPSLVS
jgi:hypothetical protein